MKEEITRNYSHFKKDLIKVFSLSGILIIIIIFLHLLDLKTDYISQIAEKIINILIKR